MKKMSFTTKNKGRFPARINDLSAKTVKKRPPTVSVTFDLTVDCQELIHVQKKYTITESSPPAFKRDMAQFFNKAEIKSIVEGLLSNQSSALLAGLLNTFVEADISQPINLDPGSPQPKLKVGKIYKAAAVGNDVHTLEGGQPAPVPNQP
ncbi:MAG: hypothetical protein WCI20_06980 [bacterium]